MTNQKEIKAISLFSGAGGMDLGFEKAGIDVVLANEINKTAAETYLTNRPSAKCLVQDINSILPSFADYQGADIVFGGPPCQGFSVIGKMSPDDPRSQLIFSFLNVVEIVKPKVFVMENVKALAKLKKWENIKNRYLERAKELGYSCKPFVLNAAEYGVPQKRERVFFVGVKGERDFQNDFLSNLDKQKCSAPVIRDLFKDLGPAGSDMNPNTCNAVITLAVHPVMRKNPYDCLLFNGIGRAIDPDGYSRTITASQGGNMTLIVDEVYLRDKAKDNWVKDYFEKVISGTIVPEFKEAPSRLRRITINETKRIQTFPDDYVFIGPKTNVYKQIGNAVPVKLAKAVASAVQETFFK